MANFLTSAFDAAEADLIGTAGVNIASTGLQSGRSSDDTTGITLSPASQWMKATLSRTAHASACCNTGRIQSRARCSMGRLV